MTDEDVSRALPNHALKILNNMHNSFFNKIRETTRDNFFIEFGFLWERSLFIKVIEEPHLEEFNFGDIPRTKLNKNDRKRIFEIWKQFSGLFAKKMSLIVEYEVAVVGENGELQENILRGKIDLISVSLMIVLKLSSEHSIIDLLSIPENMLCFIFLTSMLLNQVFKRRFRLGIY